MLLIWVDYDTLREDWMPSHSHSNFWYNAQLQCIDIFCWNFLHFCSTHIPSLQTKKNFRLIGTWAATKNIMKLRRLFLVFVWLLLYICVKKNPFAYRFFKVLEVQRFPYIKLYIATKFHCGNAKHRFSTLYLVIKKYDFELCR